MKNNESMLLDLAIRDLVALAIAANDVVLKGSFPGAVSDEVYELLRTCQVIHDAFVEVENEEK